MSGVNGKSDYYGRSNLSKEELQKMADEHINCTPSHAEIAGELTDKLLSIRSMTLHQHATTFTADLIRLVNEALTITGYRSKS